MPAGGFDMGHEKSVVGARHRARVQAVRCLQLEQWEEAVAWSQRALGHSDEDSVTLHLMALAFHGLGDTSAALHWIDQALALNGNEAAVHSNRGAFLLQLDRFSQAVGACERAVQLDPNLADAWANLGLAHLVLNQLPEAEQALTQALKRAPEHPDALLHSAHLAERREAWRMSADLYEKAIARKLCPPSVLARAAGVRAMMDDWERSEQLLAQAAASEADSPWLWTRLGAARVELGDHKSAVQAYQRASDLSPDDALARLRLVSTCPPVFQSTEEILDYRSSVLSVLNDLQDARLVLDLETLLDARVNPSFLLSYHGSDDRPIKEAYARFFERRMPQVAEPQSAEGVPKIGIVVTARHESIFIRHIEGVLTGFRPQLAHFTIFCDPSAVDTIQRRWHRADLRVVPLPRRLDLAAVALRRERLDLIYYFEINSDPLNYFLPMLRCAPIQITSLGVQTTSGQRAVDHYLSSRWIEPDGAESFYTENLVLGDSLLCCHRRPDPPTRKPSRGEFALPDRGPVYLCAQNPFKLHPDFDDLLAGILEADGEGTLALIVSNRSRVTEGLRTRLARRLGANMRRVVFIRRLPRQQYLGLIQTADVLLDSIHFGGVNTTYDGLAMNQPIVTWPGAYQKCRYTMGCYQRMGLGDAVVHSAEEYVTRAVQWGTDADAREAFRERLADATWRLFDDTSAVEDHERHFLELIEASRR